MQNTIMSYDEFCAKLQEELLLRMSMHYQNGEYKIVIGDKNDNFGHTSSWFKLINKKKPLSQPPEFSIDGAYENYVKINDFDRIINMVAVTYEKAYTVKEKEELPSVISVTVSREPGEAVCSVSDLYILNTGDMRNDILIHGDDTLGRIVEDEGCGLYVLKVGEASCIAIPGETSAEYQLCNDILKELRSIAPVLDGVEIMYYDMGSRELIYGGDEIMARLKAVEKAKKRSVFNI